MPLRSSVYLNGQFTIHSNSVTVDYSSYESVDEEEPEEVKKGPPKKAAAKSSTANAKQTDTKQTGTKQTDAKPVGGAALKKTDSKKSLGRSSSMNKGKSAGSNQKTLGSFFGGKSKG